MAKMMTTTMMMMNPPHPGELLKEDVFNELDLTVEAFAKHLEVSRVSLSRVLNGKACISPRLALRLESAGISTANFWLNLQASYDLAMARQEEQPEIHPLVQFAVCA